MDCSGVLLVTLPQFSSAEPIETWIPTTLLGMVCMSLGLAMFVNQRVVSGIREATGSGCSMSTVTFGR